MANSISQQLRELADKLDQEVKIDINGGRSIESVLAAMLLHSPKSFEITLKVGKSQWREEIEVTVELEVGKDTFRGPTLQAAFACWAKGREIEGTAAQVASIDAAITPSAEKPPF